VIAAFVKTTEGPCLLLHNHPSLLSSRSWFILEKVFWARPMRLSSPYFQLRREPLPVVVLTPFFYNGACLSLVGVLTPRWRAYTGRSPRLWSLTFLRLRVAERVVFSFLLFLCGLFLVRFALFSPHRILIFDLPKSFFLSRALTGDRRPLDNSTAPFLPPSPIRRSL